MTCAGGAAYVVDPFSALPTHGGYLRLDLQTGQVARRPLALEEGDTLLAVASSTREPRLAFATRSGRVLVRDLQDQALEEFRIQPGALEITSLSESAYRVRYLLELEDLVWVPGRNALALSYQRHAAECGPGHEGCAREVQLHELGGRELPAFRGARGGRLACTHTGNLVLALSADAHLRAYDPDSLVQAFDLDLREWATPHLSDRALAVSPAGDALALAGGEAMACYELAGRSLRWKRADLGVCAGVVFQGERLFALHERLVPLDAERSEVHATLRALDPQSGAELWRQDLEGSLRLWPRPATGSSSPTAPA